MAFTGNITWTSSPDPERSGYPIITGIPEGVEVYANVQETGGDWGWVIFTQDGDNPVQIRVGYTTSEAAKRGVWEWLRANPNG